MNDCATATLVDPETKEAELWRVVILDDDYTPMDFVVSVLKQFFDKDQLQAQDITLDVHENGMAVAGVYTKEVATQKASDTCRAAQINGHPLRALIEAS